MLRSSRSRHAVVRRALALLAVSLATFALRPARLAAQGPHDFTPADVDFVQMMILHHAQAVVMSDMAPSHGASPALQTLCKRIALSQRDEIAMMQHWLEERHLPVPDPLHMLTPAEQAASDSALHHGAMQGMSVPGMSMPGSSGMRMPGMPSMTAPNDTTPLMPGMLTPAQMRALDAAHGKEFDRLYLTGMIKHHEGALDMVASLFKTPGSGQQSELFGFATDVDAGQRVEIARMQALYNSEF
jgi:uncharacterized protein (DUF305 family)